MTVMMYSELDIPIFKLLITCQMRLLDRLL